MKHMNCIFFGHYFHASTKSSDFFKELISKKFEIDYVGIDPTNIDPKVFDVINWSNYDLVVLWQVDFLYPILSTKKLPFVVVPMFDATGGFSQLHFKLLEGSLLINFSIDLHMRSKSEGVDSIYWKYYPRIDESNRCDVIELDVERRVFFWLRNRNQISVEMLYSLFPPDNIEFLHIHTALDDGSELSQSEKELLGRYKNIELTNWFKNKEDYIDSVKNCNIFLAPRCSEGIGMGFIEAMSYGLCVVAYDEPTHNEYIINYVNGILFNHNHLGPVAIDHEILCKIRNNSIYCTRIGEKNSCKTKTNVLSEIIKFVAEYKKSNNIFSLSKNTIGYILSEGHEGYSRFVNNEASFKYLIKNAVDSCNINLNSFRKFISMRDYASAIESIDSIISSCKNTVLKESLLSSALYYLRKNSEPSGLSKKNILAPRLVNEFSMVKNPTVKRLADKYIKANSIGS